LFLSKYHVQVHWGLSPARVSLAAKILAAGTSLWLAFYFLGHHFSSGSSPSFFGKIFGGFRVPVSDVVSGESY
jgi:hypothetical protein